MRINSPARVGALVRATVVTAALGAMIGLAGCSGGDAPVVGDCSVDNCGGCCLGGQCYQGTVAEACGAGGQSCQICTTGQTCSAGSCSGGSSGGCSHLTCPGGCCSAAGQCVSPPTDFQCGTSGALCQACPSDQSCTVGQCAAKQPTGCAECFGCCHDGTTCLAGNTSAACGEGGGACEACVGGQVCDKGACVTPTQACDASSCAGGCCSAEGACVPYNKQGLDACGKAGAACSVCPGGTLDCAEGTCVEQQGCASFCASGCCNAQDECVAPAQQDGISCGTAGAACEPCPGGTSCVAGACVGGSAWEVWAISATIAPKTPAGSDWDNSWVSNPNPDPFFGIAASWATWIWQYDYSSTQDNTFNPAWNEKVAVWDENALLDPSGVQLVVVDDDLGSGAYNDEIGKCTVVLTAGILQAGTYTLACGSATSLTIKFVKQAAP